MLCLYNRNVTCHIVSVQEFCFLFLFWTNFREIQCDEISAALFDLQSVTKPESPAQLLVWFVSLSVWTVMSLFILPQWILNEAVRM